MIFMFLQDFGDLLVPSLPRTEAFRYLRGWFLKRFAKLMVDECNTSDTMNLILETII
jgi:hypothetical protein